jgi:hypothetical protein
MRPWPTDPEGYCPSHSPLRATARAAERSRGGQAHAGRPVDPSSPQAPNLTSGPKIIATLDRAAKAMATGDMSAREAAALAALGRLALATLERDQAADIARLAKLVEERAPQTIGRRR